MEVYDASSLKSFLAMLFVFIYIVVNVNVAWNVFKYANALERDSGRKLAFIDSILWLPISLVLGLPLALVLSFVESNFTLSRK